MFRVRGQGRARQGGAGKEKSVSVQEGEVAWDLLGCGWDGRGER